MVGADKVYSLLQDLGHHNLGEDILIWIENVDEKFTTKSTWSCLRIRAPEVDPPKWVWHPSLPKRISVSIWKFSLYALSVDDNVCQIGIPIVSKCHCCENGGYEDLNHLFATGDFAELLWDKVCICYNQCVGGVGATRWCVGSSRRPKKQQKSSLSLASYPEFSYGVCGLEDLKLAWKMYMNLFR